MNILLIYIWTGENNNIVNMNTPMTRIQEYYQLMPAIVPMNFYMDCLDKIDIFFIYRRKLKRILLSI